MSYKVPAHFFISFILISFLSSCTPNLTVNPNPKTEQEGLEAADYTPKLEEILKGENLVAVVQKNQLFLIDPTFAKPLAIYTFGQDEQPLDIHVDSFVISPSKKWIVWYTPRKGILALDILKQKTTVISQPSDFLNTNPYVEFLPSKDTVQFITNKGNVLQRYNLISMKNEQVSIPYPYGNLFKTAPDEKHVLFISGFGQAQTEPKFMFTAEDGSSPVQFTTKTHLAYRQWVFWDPDSKGVLMINNHTLEFYPADDPNRPEVMFALQSDDEILSARPVKDNVFIYSKKGFWHIFNFKTQKEVARSPLAIAQELKNPRFYPWTDTQFLIEEVIPNENVQFNRLWLSDFKGNKKMIVEHYNEMEIINSPQVVD